MADYKPKHDYPVGMATFNKIADTYKKITAPRQQEQGVGVFTPSESRGLNESNMKTPYKGNKTSTPVIDMGAAIKENKLYERHKNVKLRTDTVA